MAHPQAGCGDKPLGEYFFPSLANVGSPILIPKFQANQWEIKPSIIQMVMRNPFIGEKNPYTHLTLFLELCATFKLLDVPQEVIYLKLVPFSLMGRAKKWLYSHEPNTFTSWDELAKAFLLHFFPPAITKKFKQQIRAFEQDEEESFYETFERFKDLLRECPHHNLNKWDLLESFYDGLTPNGKSQLDQSSGGAFMDLKVEDGYKMIEKIARNSHLWGGEKVSKRKDQEETPRKEKEVNLVFEDKSFEDHLDITNRASKENFFYEDDEDTISQVEEVLIGKECEDTIVLVDKPSNGKEFEVKSDSTPLLSNPRYEPPTLFANALFELEDFSLCDNELFDDDSSRNDMFKFRNPLIWKVLP